MAPIGPLGSKKGLKTFHSEKTHACDVSRLLGEHVLKRFQGASVESSRGSLSAVRAELQVLLAKHGRLTDSGVLTDQSSRTVRRVFRRTVLDERGEGDAGAGGVSALPAVGQSCRFLYTKPWMRLLLAFMAVIGLLLSPAAAAAAQEKCNHQAGMMSIAKAPGMAQAGDQKSDPCCDPSKHQGETRHDDMGCLQACAVMGGVVAALPSPALALIAPPSDKAPGPGRLASLKPHEPGRLERPPRSIA
jgi:hypothetical protein